jgi:glycosyltransferase involved in cell wall biosynthesis
MGPRNGGAPHVVFLSGRDTGHPQGGGSERYLERVAFGLAERGYCITICCSAYPGAAADEMVRGVRFRRRGNDLTVRWYALLLMLRVSADLVVDVQNGLPFLSRLFVRCPVVVLVHHLHREQWRLLFGPVVGRIGWWIESWLGPRVYRRCRYVTVSQATRRGLARLGIPQSRTVVIHNGLDAAPAVAVARSPEPRLVAVSRLVPHKRLEHAIEAVARLRARWPSLRLEIIGQGAWHDRLRAYAATQGVADAVDLRGWLPEEGKHAVLARSWVHLCPSVKEGWGVVVIEAAAHGVPTVAYRSAGGVAESVRHGDTGLLVPDDLDQFVTAVQTLLEHHELRARMAAACAARALEYGWDTTVDAFDTLVARELGRPRRAYGAAVEAPVIELSGPSVVAVASAAAMAVVKGPLGRRHRP